MILKTGIIKKSSFLKNAFILISGTAVAQLINIAASPLLTRIFTPADFGQFTIYTSLLNIFGTLIGGRYELAILLPKYLSESLRIFMVAILLAISFSIILPLGIYLTNRFILPNLISDPWIFPALTVSFLLFAYQNTASYMANRLGQYKAISAAKVAQSVVTLIAQITLGLFVTTKSSLATGYTIGLVASAILCTKMLSLRPGLFRTDFHRLRHTYHTYRKFLYINTPSSLLDNLSIFAPVFFIQIAYGDDQLGFYSLAFRINTIPATLIAQAVTQLFYKKISGIIENKSLVEQTMKKMIKLLLLIGLPIAVGMATLSPFVFSFIFGKEWISSGHLLQIMSLSFLVRFIVSPISSILIASGKLSMLAKWQVIYFIVLVTSSIVGVLYLTINYLVFLYAIVDIVLYMYYYYIIKKAIK